MATPIRNLLVLLALAAALPPHRAVAQIASEITQPPNGDNQRAGSRSGSVSSR